MAEEPEDLDIGTAGVRPFWSGAITFGMVTVPVGLYPATRSRATALRMVGPDDAPVRRVYVCSKDDKPIEADDIVRGYEIEKGRFVAVTDAELESLAPRKSREIDLRVFVDLDEIDPMLFDRAWFLVPAEGTNKAYRLLANVMEKERQAGIATFVMRGKELIVAIIAEKGILRAETLRFTSDVRSAEDVGLPEKVKAPAAEQRKFETQIARHGGKMNLRDFLDDYPERLEKLAKSKEKKGTVIREVRPEPEEGGEVIDLMAALRKSLGTTAKPRRKKAR